MGGGVKKSPKILQTSYVHAPKENYYFIRPAERWKGVDTFKTELLGEVYSDMKVLKKILHLDNLVGDSIVFIPKNIPKIPLKIFPGGLD